MEKFDRQLHQVSSQPDNEFHKELLDERAKLSNLRIGESSTPLNPVGRHRVKAGETLWSIAKQSLSSEETGQPSAAEIKAEVARIVELNSQRYSYLKKSPKSLQAGAVLDVYLYAGEQPNKPSYKKPKENSNHEPTPKQCYESKPWKIVNKGESADAERCDYVIAHSGSKVVAYEGSEVYANRGAFVLALPGSRVHAKPGSRVAAHGVKIDADSGAIILDM